MHSMSSIIYSIYKHSVFDELLIHTSRAIFFKIFTIKDDITIDIYSFLCLLINTTVTAAATLHIFKKNTIFYGFYIILYNVCNK